MLAITSNIRRMLQYEWVRINVTRKRVLSPTVAPTVHVGEAGASRDMGQVKTVLVNGRLLDRII